MIATDQIDDQQLQLHYGINCSMEACGTWGRVDGRWFEKLW